MIAPARVDQTDRVVVAPAEVALDVRALTVTVLAPDLALRRRTSAAKSA